MTTDTTPAPGGTADLRDRLQRAVSRLTERRDEVCMHPTERMRLDGKIEGVKLALSYISDGERTAVMDDRPRLAVTSGIVQAFEAAYRAMLREESKPPGKRDPLPAVRVYAQAEILAAMLRASGVRGLPEDEPNDVLVALKDLLAETPDTRQDGVHGAHCCTRHGCKYGESVYCPVMTGRVPQEYPCEQCDDEEG